ATLVKDAQRHGLKVRPIDVMKSDWRCTLEPNSPPQLRRGGAKRRGGVDQQMDSFDQHHPSRGCASTFPSSTEEGSFFTLRLGMRYVRGMRESVAQAIVEERKRSPFTSIDNLARR